MRLFAALRRLCLSCLCLACEKVAYRRVSYQIPERTAPRLRTEGTVMPLCSGRNLPDAVSIAHYHFRQSAGPGHLSLASLNRHTARTGHLAHRHSSSNVPWRARRHISDRTLETWSRNRSHPEAVSRSSSNDEQPSNGVAEESATSSSPERESSSSKSDSGATEASTSAQSSASEPAQSALEQIGARYPVLGRALETKDAVGAGTEQPQAVLQAFLSRVDELWRIGAGSMVWTAAGLMQLVTKPILPRSAYIAELKKALQVDPSNADK